MGEIKPATQPAQQAAQPETQKLWPIVGKAWYNTDKKGRKLLSIVIGNRREPFGEIVLKPEDRLVLRQNNKREGRKDADYQVCLVPSQVST